MTRHAWIALGWTALALATVLVVGSDPSLTTFGLAALSWSGGIASYALVVSARTSG